MCLVAALSSLPHTEICGKFPDGGFLRMRHEQDKIKVEIMRTELHWAYVNPEKLQAAVLHLFADNPERVQKIESMQFGKGKK